MRLYSETERVEAVVDGAPVGPTGRLFIVEPAKVTQVPDVAGKFIMDHLAYTGVVRVNETESEEGVKFDIEDAKKRSLEALAEQDHVRFQKFVNNCVDDYIKRNKPVPPPDEGIMRIIKRRGYDLRSFGIIPIGWDLPEKDKAVTALKSENDLLKGQLADLSSKLDLLVQQQALNQALREDSGGQPSGKPGK